MTDSYSIQTPLSRESPLQLGLRKRRKERDGRRGKKEGEERRERKGEERKEGEEGERGRDITSIEQNIPKLETTTKTEDATFSVLLSL